ncbi:uncharacterized protein SEPMUDRAFT_109833 [Sphaerulina musiva SO2202]|uniref:Uncharacterized protein n=1 Tax=Sphaerulina musiva (strain SO2202) TaxID=692275 RepID=N1QE27_SPHMS|nr:uncharacterized protein SEPMUDRAFT_109833 [Sphaerulina musiva SO2202]EMF10535.1 hypothetical protein SEPMUDRAFT_109833 [Sphaerulina musiva SO2202]
MPSSTQSPTNNTTTTTTSPPSTTPSDPSTTTPTSLAKTSPKPFRLLDLPFELVSQILEHSIEGVSSETEPIEIAFSSSSSSSSCVTTTNTTPIIEEGKGEKTTREEKESQSIILGVGNDIIEMKYPPHHHHNTNNTKEEPPHPHPGIFQTCRILRYEALHIHLRKSFFTFPCAGPGIRGIRLDEAAAAEKRGLVDEVYLKMREELLVGRNGMLSKVSCAVDLKKDVIW